MVTDWCFARNISVFLLFLPEKFHEGDTSDLSALDIILIKSALSPSSNFIDDFDILCWRFCISDFNILFSIRYDWIVALFLSRDVREIWAFGFKGIVNEFAFRFIDLLFLCNLLFIVIYYCLIYCYFYCFWLQPIHTEVFVSIEHLFDPLKIGSCKGSLLSWNGINTFGMECFTSKE